MGAAATKHPHPLPCCRQVFRGAPPATATKKLVNFVYSCAVCFPQSNCSTKEATKGWGTRIVFFLCWNSCIRMQSPSGGIGPSAFSASSWAPETPSACETSLGYFHSIQPSPPTCRQSGGSGTSSNIISLSGPARIKPKRVPNMDATLPDHFDDTHIQWMVMTMVTETVKSHVTSLHVVLLCAGG
jgi:hypothetical protein